MVLTRTMRRKAEEQYGVDNNIDAVLSALSPAAYALERPGAAVEPVSGNSKPTLLRKSSSLQAITETARLVRSESWRHIERQLELAASGTEADRPGGLGNVKAARRFLLDATLFLRSQANTLWTSSSPGWWPSRPSSIW